MAYELVEAGPGTPLRSAGAPSAGTNEVQTLTIGGTPTSGTFYLNWGGNSIGPITWSSTNATLLANINTALDAFFGSSQVVAAAGSLTAGIGTITLTFSGANVRRQAQPSVFSTTNVLSGTSPTLAVAETTPGVDATGRGMPVGGLVIDTTNGKLYINTGAATAPTWTVVGAQT